MRTYICPSDPTNVKPGQGNYAANQLVFSPDTPNFRDEHLTAHVPDGLSNTIMCAEVLGQFTTSPFETPVDVYWSGIYAQFRPYPMYERRTNEWGGCSYCAATPHTVMHVAVADGSVRVLPVDGGYASYATWIRAATPDDGYPLGPGW